MFSKKQKISIAFLSIGFVITLVVNVACGIMSEWLTTYFGGRGVDFSGDNVELSTRDANQVCQDIEAEGIIMLKNKNNALPLNDTKNINVFGWSSTDAGFVMCGSGSGSALERGNGDNVNYFLSSLKKDGFSYNEDLIKLYTDYKNKKDGSGQSLYDSPSVFFKLYEPNPSIYTDDIMMKAKDFSDTALVVISRLGGEGPDLPKEQYKYKLPTDTNRNYLQLSTEEEGMIEKVKNNGFKKVIIVINACNVMELGFLNDDKIDAAISVGGPGQSGCLSIAKMLKGEINPSGKTVDTYAYDLTTAASYNNAPMTGQDSGSEIWGVKQYTNMKAEYAGQYIDYAEDIYVGYKWYETADIEGFWNSSFAKDKWNVNGYNDVVQYPFGYGLSYTKFKWEVLRVSPRNNAFLEKNGKIEIDVKVTNIGDFPGKDVVEVYYSPQYNKGGIEKSAVNLLAFAKTELLQKNESEILKIKFDVEDMKSYDCYDANHNGYATYELEKGKYSISIRTDAHNIANCENSIIEYNVENNVFYDKDSSTNNVVENKFTDGEDAYSGVSIDGRNSGANIKYLSRNNFKDTFPEYTPARAKNQNIINLGNNWYDKTSISQNLMPKQGDKSTNLSLSIKDENGVTTYNDELVSELGNPDNFDCENWELLLNQITVPELINLCELGGFRTYQVDSIGKPACIDLDGPTGLNNSIASIATSSWTCYPIEIVLASSWNIELAYKFGRSVGTEAAATNVSGWYAPCVNLHRSPFSGRNFECFSEDPILSGEMCAMEVFGALSKGLYCYMKHFAVYEAQTNPAGIYVWLTEQNLRENYLKPFEIAVKKGKANAIMSSFNRVGANWAGGNKGLLIDILREEWGFKGSVVTDWTSGGDYMNVDQGLHTGGDLWLTGSMLAPSGHNDKSSADGIMVMRNAAKNIIYTYCNTYYIAKTQGSEITFKSRGNIFPYWIFILGGFDLIAVSGLIVGSIFTIKSIKKKKKCEDCLI